MLLKYGAEKLGRTSSWCILFFIDFGASPPAAPPLENFVLDGEQLQAEPGRAEKRRESERV